MACGGDTEMSVVIRERIRACYSYFTKHLSLRLLVLDRVQMNEKLHKVRFVEVTSHLPPTVCPSSV